MSLPNSVNARHEFKQNFAIIIGINEYKSETNKLKAAVNDAKRLAVFLGDEKRKTIWQGDEWYQVLLLTDQEATHENLTKLLENLKNGKIDFPGQIIEFKNQKIQVSKKEKPVILQKWDRLLFYFAGHGNLDQDNKKDSYKSLQLWSQDEKYVPVNDLLNTLKELPCQHKLLILDCCYSAGVQGSFGKQETSYRTPSISGQKSYREDYDYLWKNPTFTVITSGGYRPVPDCGESTPEHSPFAAVLFEALENGYYDRETDSNNDKILTAHEIYNYILGDNRVKTKQHPEIFFPTEQETMLGQYFFLRDDFNPKDLGDIKGIDNPYKGLFAYEEEDKPIFGGRDELVKKLFECVNQEQNNQNLTIITGASGSGKSSIVKAGLIPLLRESSTPKTGSEQSDKSNQAKQWTILEVMRPGKSPLNAFAKTILPIYDNDLLDEIYKLPLIDEKGEHIPPYKKWSMFINDFDTLKNKDNEKKLEELKVKIKNKLDELNQELKFNTNAHQQEPEKIIGLINTLNKNLNGINSHVLLFIDQFEELITLSEPQEKDSFFKLLGQIIKNPTNFHVVVTVRSDLEIHFRDSSKASNSSNTSTKSDIKYWNAATRLVVDEMNSDQLRQAIIIPSRRFIDNEKRILVFESEALVSKIIDDVRGRPGALALLSFTLDKLYKEASSQKDPHKIILKKDDYNNLGDVSGALTQRATEVYNKLGKSIEEKDKGQFTQKYERDFGKPIPAEHESPGKVCQAMMKQLMLRMTTTQEGSLAKRPVPISELQYPEWRSRYENATYRMCQVIDLLIKERLIVSNSYESKKGDHTEPIPYVEPAHDALILYLDWDKLSENNKFQQQEQERRASQFCRLALLRWAKKVAILLLGVSFFSKVDAPQESQNKVQRKEEILALRDRLIPDIKEWQKHGKQRNNNKAINFIIEGINTIFEVAVRFDLETKLIVLIRVSIGLIIFVIVFIFVLILILELIVAGESLTAEIVFGVIMLSGLCVLILLLGLILISPKIVFKLFFVIAKKALKLSPFSCSLKNDLESKSKAKNLEKIIWDKNSKLEEVRQLLYCRDSWLNKDETEFVRQSVIHKKRGQLLSLVSITVGLLVISVSGILAVLAQREATIKSAEVLRESAEAKLKLNDDLQATIDLLRAYKTLAPLKQLFWKPEKEMTEVKRTFYKAFYGVRQRNRIQLNRGSAYDMALSPDGTKLVTIGGDDTVILWDTSNGKSLDQFPTEQKDVWSVAFSPDGQLIATGGNDGTVKLWEIEKNGNVKRWTQEDATTPQDQKLNSEQFKTQHETVYSIAFVNKEKNKNKGEYKLATIGKDDKVRVWDISSGNMEGEIQTNQESISRLAFSSQKKLLAIVGGDNQLRLCKFRFSGQKIEFCNTPKNKLSTQRAGEDILYSVAFTTEGNLVTGGEDNKVKLWKISNNNNVTLLDSKSQPDEKEIQQGSIYSLGWSTDNKLATLGVDHTVMLRDSSGKEILPFRPPTKFTSNTSVAFSPDGKLLATANDDGMVQLWDASGKRLNRIRTGQERVNSVVFSTDQQFIVTGGKYEEDGIVQLWDKLGIDQVGEIKTQQKEVMSVVLNSQDSTQLGTFGADGTFKIWEIPQDMSTLSRDQLIEPIETIETKLTQIKNAVFTPDNDQVITLTKDGNVQLWQDSQNQKDLSENFPVTIKSLALSHDGEKLVIGGDDGTVWVWDGSEENKPTRLLQTLQGSIDALAYTSDSKIATVGEDGTLRLWETSGNSPIELPEKKQGVRSIAFNSNGDNFSFDSDNTKLATVGENNTVSLWDTFGNLLKHIQIQSGVASSVALSPNGNLLVIGEKDGKVKLLDTSGNQLDQIQLKQGVVTNLSFHREYSEDREDKLLVTIEEHDQINSFWLIDIGKTPKSSNTSNPKFHTSPRQLCFDSVALSNSGKLAGVTQQGMVKVYSGNFLSEMPNNKECSESSLPEQPDEFLTQQGGVTSLALSSNNELLATVGNDGTLRLGNTEGTEFDKIPTLQSEIKRVVFSPDSKLLATIGNKTDDNKTTLKLWKISEEDSTREDHTFNPFKNLFKWWSSSEKIYKLSLLDTQENISNIAFSPDGKFLATLGTDAENKVNSKITLWKLGTDEELFTEICNWAADYIKTSQSLDASDRKLCDQATNERNPVAKVSTSIGEKIIIPIDKTQENKTQEKQDAVNAIAAGDLQTAVSLLEASLQKNRNDPEALIYLNNARIGAANSYTIAVPVPITNNPNTALEILRGVAQAQDEINQMGGINGIKLRILIADDKNDKQIAEQMASELVKNPDILGVVGHLSSDVTLAVSEIYEAGKIAAISPTSTSVSLSANKDQYTFRTAPSDKETAKTLAKYMLDKFPQKKPVIFYNKESEYSNSLKNQFETEINSPRGRVTECDSLKNQLVTKINSARGIETECNSVDLSDYSFDAAKEVNSIAPETVLVLMPNTELLDKAIEVVQENAKGKKLPIIAGDAVYNLKTLKEGQADAVDMVVAVPWLIRQNSQTTFVETSEKLWGADVNWRTAMSYDATAALIEAIKRNPTREGVAKSLREQGFTANGATDKVQFAESGDRKEPKIQLVKIEPGNRSGSGYDFVPVP